VTRSLAVILLLTSATSAVAQQTIQWMRNPQQAVALAQRNNRPLMVWVASGRDERDDLERDQKRAFRDPRVIQWSRAFVTLRISPTVHRDLLPQFGLPSRASLELSFVTPDGEKLSGLSGGAVAQPDSLAKKMMMVLQAFGKRVYEKDVKPVLENEDAKPKELKVAIDTINDLHIVAADKGLVELLDRERLGKSTRKTACEALAQLSTKVAVDKLLELAKDDPIAAGSLSKCTPAGAEMMLGAMIPTDEPVEKKPAAKEAEGEKPGEEGEQEKAKEEPQRFNYPVYKAVTRICRVPKPKPESYFEKAPDDRIAQEVERVSEIVRDVAARWKAQYE
jgi:hypothetical protein